MSLFGLFEKKKTKEADLFKNCEKIPADPYHAVEITENEAGFIKIKNILEKKYVFIHFNGNRRAIEAGTTVSLTRNTGFQISYR